MHGPWHRTITVHARAACSLHAFQLRAASFHTPVKELSCGTFSGGNDLCPALCLWAPDACCEKLAQCFALYNTPLSPGMVTVREFEGRGRGLVAAVPIQAGDVVLEDSPCLLWINRSAAQTSCAACLRSLTGAAGTCASRCMLSALHMTESIPSAQLVARLRRACLRVRMALASAHVRHLLSGAT